MRCLQLLVCILNLTMLSSLPHRKHSLNSRKLFASLDSVSFGAMIVKPSLLDLSQGSLSPAHAAESSLDTGKIVQLETTVNFGSMRLVENLAS